MSTCLAFRKTLLAAHRSSTREGTMPSLAGDDRFVLAALYRRLEALSVNLM